MMIVAIGLLYIVGARGLLLFALALLISGIASFVLLSRQRDAMSVAVNRRIEKATARAADIRDRIDEGTRVEDED